MRLQLLRTRSFLQVLKAMNQHVRPFRPAESTMGEFCSILCYRTRTNAVTRLFLVPHSEAERLLPSLPLSLFPPLNF